MADAATDLEAGSGGLSRASRGLPTTPGSNCGTVTRLGDPGRQAAAMCLNVAREQPEPLPDDLAAAHAMILAERAARHRGRGAARRAGRRIARQADEVAALRLEIERLKLLLAKARREQFGQSVRARGQAHRAARAAAGRARGDARPKRRRRPRSPHPTSAARGAGGSTRKPARRPLPEHLPRERIVYPAPCSLPQVRRPGPQARRGRDRDARVRAAALEGGRARAREGQLPRAARRSASRRRPRTRSPAAGPAPTCSPWCWPRSTASTCR